MISSLITSITNSSAKSSSMNHAALASIAAKSHIHRSRVSSNRARINALAIMNNNMDAFSDELSIQMSEFAKPMSPKTISRHPRYLQYLGAASVMVLGVILITFLALPAFADAQQRFGSADIITIMSKKPYECNSRVVCVTE